MITMIPLDQLDLSPLNPRRAAPPEAEIRAFAASISARLADSPDTAGLIENLTAHALEGGRYGVADGGRRLRGLKLLAEKGEIAADRPIPCLVWPRSVEIAAAAANITRRPLGAVEEFRAYAAQVEAGHNVEEIAAAFAVAPRDVRRRLKLAAVHPEILAAFEAGEIGESVLQAFTIEPDQARQLKVFRSEARPSWLHAHNVRAKLSPKDNDRTAAGLGFVGREAYLAAGGKLTEDLFSDHLVIHDPKIVRDLVAERLAADVARVTAEGWRWVEALEGYSYNAIHATRELTPDTADRRSKADKARMKEIEALEETGALDNDLVAEYRDLCARMEEPVWPEAARAVAGVFLWPQRDGTIGVSEGRVREEDLDAAAAAGFFEGADAARPGAPEAAEAGPEAGWAKSLVDEMRALHGLAARTALMAKPDLALDVLTLHFGGRGRDILSEEFDRTRPPPETGYGAVTIDPALHREAKGAAALAALREGGRKARNAELAAAIARRLVRRLPGENAAYDAIFAEAAPDAAAAIRAVWAPDAEFFRRLKAAQLVEVFEELVEKAPGDCGVAAKKGDLVKTLAAMFADPKYADNYPTAAPKLARWIPALLRGESA